MTIIKYILPLAISIAFTALLVSLQIYQYRRLSAHPWKDVFSHKRTLIVYVVIRILIIFTLTRSVLRGEIESTGCCILALILLEMPLVVERRFQIEFSPTMEITIFLFVFAAEILGEVENYYVLVPGWDTALHTMNGFLCAAIGFCLVDMLNRSEGVEFKMSPTFLAIVAFCFSMTIGVLWEFFEFASDYFWAVDMQKDYIVETFHSVTLDPTMKNIPIAVKNITKTIIECADGKQVEIAGGYLDIGNKDTMKDLIVNCVGALTFSILGYIGAKRGSQSKIAQIFIPLVKHPGDILSDSVASENENKSDR